MVAAKRHQVVQTSGATELEGGEVVDLATIEGHCAAWKDATAVAEAERPTLLCGGVSLLVGDANGLDHASICGSDEEPLDLGRAKEPLRRGHRHRAAIGKLATASDEIFEILDRATEERLGIEQQ